DLRGQIRLEDDRQEGQFRATNEVHKANGTSRNNRHRAMLVSVPEFLKYPKGIPGSLVPRRERLLILEDGPEFSPNSPKGSGMAAIPSSFGQEDRKAHVPPPALAGRQGLPRLPALLTNGEKPRQLVEGRAEVVNGISHENTQLRCRKLTQDIDANPYFADFRVWLG